MDYDMILKDLSPPQRLRLGLLRLVPNHDLLPDATISQIMAYEAFVLAAGGVAVGTGGAPLLGGPRDSLDDIEAELAATAPHAAFTGLPPAPPPLCEATPQLSILEMLETMGTPAAEPEPEPEPEPVNRHAYRWDEAKRRQAREALLDRNLTLPEVAAILGRTPQALYTAVVRNALGLDEDRASSILRRWSKQRLAAGLKLAEVLAAGKRGQAQ